MSTPRSWLELRILGQEICGSVETTQVYGDEKIKSATAAASAFLSGVQERTSKKGLGAETEEALRAEVEEASVKFLGPLGRLALCENIALARSPAGVLMAATNILLLREARESLLIALECVGSGVDEDEEDKQGCKTQWRSKDYWPELFPPKWASVDGLNFSLLYRVDKMLGERAKQASPDEVARATSVRFLVKGVMMGKMLLVNAVVLSSDDDDGLGVNGELAPPVSCGLTIKDFVAAGTDQAAIKMALDGLDKDGLGLCGLITRASALQLASTLRNQVMDPLLSKFLPKLDADKAASSSSASSGIATRSTGATGVDGCGGNGTDVNGAFRGGRDWRDPRGGTVGIGGPAAGFGDPDLYPSFGGVGPGGLRMPGGNGGGGGMLFGPGNPNFDNNFGRWGGGPRAPGLPSGVPPGARFDPFGPPGTGGRSGGCPPGGGHFGIGGEPNPDHLQPPGGHGGDNIFW